MIRPMTEKPEPYRICIFTDAAGAAVDAARAARAADADAGDAWWDAGAAARAAGAAEVEKQIKCIKQLLRR